MFIIIDKQRFFINREWNLINLDEEIITQIKKNFEYISELSKNEILKHLTASMHLEFEQAQVTSLYFY